VLHPLAVNFNVIVENCLEPNLYNAKILNEFIDFASEKKQTEYPVHIKFNTGLNRLGFLESDLEYISDKIKSNHAIKVKSLFSHLAASEDLNERDFTLNQIHTFKTIVEKFKTQVGYTPMHHMCNTSGILNYPESHFDMVRSGIGLYGFGNSEKESAHLKPIASLKTVISQIHTIKKGESVGYNRAFLSDKLLTKIATLPLGHADGIGRIYGNGKGFVTINGRKAKIVGNVCMDMVMVNVSDIECNEGDEVIVFNGNTTTAERLAETANTISYELITSISQRVKRIFIDD
jgi:alanine racemase